MTKIWRWKTDSRLPRARKGGVGSGCSYKKPATTIPSTAESLMIQAWDFSSCFVSKKTLPTLTHHPCPTHCHPHTALLLL